MEQSSVLEWIDGIDASIFSVDLSGHVTAWNRATECLLGYSSEEMTQRPLCSLEGCDERIIKNILAVGVDQSSTSSSQGQAILTVSTKKGSSITLQLKLAAQRNRSGELLGVVCFAEEIKPPQMTNGDHNNGHNHKETQEPAGMGIHVCVEEASALIFGVDQCGTVNIWNKRSVKVMGVSKENALGRSIVDILTQSNASEFSMQLIQNALRGNSTSGKIGVCVRPGEHRCLLINSSAQLDHAGTQVGTFFVAQELKQSEEDDESTNMMLQEVLCELRLLIDESNALIFGIDNDGDINEWNVKMMEATGYSKEDVFDLNFIQEFVILSLQQSMVDVIENALQGFGTSNYELEFTTIDGDVRYLLVNASTRRNVHGTIVGLLCIAEDVTESAQHDRAVAAMARELRQLVDTANAPIFGIDVDGNVNEWNDKTAEITGFTGDEAFNRPMVETFIVPHLRPSIQEVMDNALKGRGTSNYELEFRTKTNEVRFLLVNATTRRDAENNIVGVVGVAQDVTEAAKHDRAVAAMANELRQLIDTANAPIFGIDVDGDVNEWNDKTAEITGYTKEEAFDCELVETFIVEPLRDSIQEVMDNALQGRGTSNYELEFRTKSNEIVHLLVNATTRRDAENNVVGVVGVAQDVTEAVHRDRAVAGMANELRQLIDTANAPIFGIDSDGNVNEWNNKTAEITGYLKEEAFDEPLVETFIAPAMRRQVQEIMSKALSGDATSNYELEIVARSKEIKVLLVNATTRRDPDGNIVGVVGVAQDVTEDRKHSKELREMHYFRASQEAKVETERNMTAYFAHELRNPLGAIDSALSAMPDHLPESAKSLVSGMQLCTGFMSSIMNNLLDVRKMEEGKMKLNAVPISLEATLDSIHKMLLPSIRPNVEFLAFCETTGKDWVLGDSHRIQQIMTNVITNAIKYTVSGSVTLSISWEGAFVRFVCADTGPGIPKSEQKKLFERYVQRGGAPGTGLGLAIAKHLVGLAGGSICFDSDPRVRPGTSCIVLMPLPECAPPDIILRADDKLIESELVFLIIDDVKMNRMMLKRRIMKGIAPNSIVREASTGEEALLICGTEKFHVIVVDQYMEEAGGVMVGTDVVFAMRRMRIESIIIGCSGNDMDEQFKEAGADFVWKKPMPSNSTIIADLRRAMMRKNMPVT